jgi:hypothetical protein
MDWKGRDRKRAQSNLMYRGESVNKSQMDIKSCNVSPGSSTVQHHDRLGSRRACACSEAGFSRQNGDHA